MPLNDALGRLAWLQGQRWWVVGEEGADKDSGAQLSVAFQLTSPRSEKNQTGGACCTSCGWQTLILHQSELPHADALPNLAQLSIVSQ